MRCCHTPHPADSPPPSDGAEHASFVMCASSRPASPEGRSRWTLKLLADKVVELELVDSPSCETVRRTLKKTVYCGVRVERARPPVPLADRLGSEAAVAARATPWARDRNRSQAGVDWQFTTDDARTKLRRFYPKVRT